MTKCNLSFQSLVMPIHSLRSVQAAEASQVAEPEISRLSGLNIQHKEGNRLEMTKPSKLRNLMLINGLIITAFPQNHFQY